MHRDGCIISCFCFKLVQACRPFYRALCFLFSDVLAPPELTHQLTRVGVGVVRSVLDVYRLHADMLRSKNQMLSMRCPQYII